MITKGKRNKNLKIASFWQNLKVDSAQNVSSEAQVKNFFILYKNSVPFSRYSNFCIF